MPLFTANMLPAETVAHITGVTYSDNPHITIDRLRQLTLTYIDFEGKEKVGPMICAAEAAEDLLWIFSELYKARYQIEKIRLADEYGGDDDLIMADNCSSCFNYRFVAGTTTLSMHALGRAVDINPRYNPYITGGKILPSNGAEYADRSRDFPHKIDSGDLCLKLFKKRGWKWGGDWAGEKDYQHFYMP